MRWWLLESAGAGVVLVAAGYLWSDASARALGAHERLAVLEGPAARAEPADPPSAARRDPAATRIESAPARERLPDPGPLAASVATLRVRARAAADRLQETAAAAESDLEPELARLEAAVRDLPAPEATPPERQDEIHKAIGKLNAEQRQRMFSAFLPNIIKQTVKDLDNKLALTAAQKPQVQELVSAFFTELSKTFASAFDGQFKADEDNQKVFRELEDRFETRLRPILTDEQFAKYAKDKASRRSPARKDDQPHR